MGWLIAIIGYSMLFPHSLLSTIEMGYKPTTVIIVVVSQWGMSTQSRTMIEKNAVLNHSTKGSKFWDKRSIPFRAKPKSNPRANLLRCFRLLSGLGLHCCRVRKDLGNCKVGGTTGSPRIKLLRAESSQKQKPEKPPPIGDLKAHKAPRSPWKSLKYEIQQRAIHDYPTFLLGTLW
jgi:hypothetical protein